MENLIDDAAFREEKLPQSLKTLTLLTIIGSIIGIIGAIWQFFSIKTTYENRDELLAQFSDEKTSGFARKMIGDPSDFIENVTRAYENRVPILAIGVVAPLLCLYAALQMRKLKKEGYPIYLVGEWLPLAMYFFLPFNGVAAYFSIAIIILFTILYTVNRKYLVR